VESLHKRRATGRPSRLNLEQQQGVAEIFRAGARAAGFADDRWTTARFAAAINKGYGIRYDPDHVGRIMHQLGLRPRHHAVERTAPEVIYAPPAAMTVTVAAEQSAA
jgi:transposase